MDLRKKLKDKINNKLKDIDDNSEVTLLLIKYLIDWITRILKKSAEREMIYLNIIMININID